MKKASLTWAVKCDCGWSYPPGRGTVALKSDVEEQAKAHRGHGCNLPGQTRIGGQS